MTYRFKIHQSIRQKFARIRGKMPRSRTLVDVGEKKYWRRRTPVKSAWLLAFQRIGSGIRHLFRHQRRAGRPQPNWKPELFGGTGRGQNDVQPSLMWT
jgi:hypothetical protein